MPGSGTEDTRLRVASDTLLHDLELLQSLETEKRGVPPSDPRFPDLARQIERLAAHVLEASTAQRAAGDGLRADEGPQAEVPIDEAPPRPMHEILAEWREAERRAGVAEAGSLEASVAASDADRLREEYRRASAFLARGGE